MSDLVGTQIVGFLTHRLICHTEIVLVAYDVLYVSFNIFRLEPVHEKTNNLGFRPGPT